MSWSNGNPGSAEALKRGCKCPVIDNHHGEGRPHFGGNQFVISGDCQLHRPLFLQLWNRDDKEEDEK